MTFQNPALRAAALFALGAATVSAHATNGYFAHGYGIKAKGMGGAGLALAQDAFAGANNPAQAAFAGNRMEAGLEFFMPKRETSRSYGGMALGTVESEKTQFYVPEFGYNVGLSQKLGIGISVYGNGGMNTTYPGGTTDCTAFGGMAGSNALCGMGKLGVDLTQLIVAPTIAYRVSDNHAIGVSPLFVYQQFSAYGLDMFKNFTNPPNADAVTNNGHDSSTGFGLRLGYLGRFGDRFSVGASYAPEISMSRFKDYAGLFAEGGKFNIPENLGLGVAFQVTPALQVALDYNRINYSKVPAIGNAPSLSLGGPSGGGFGWSDVNVVKVGVQWQVNQNTTLRMGINHGDNPVPSANLTPNILAPGVMTTHITIGGTHAMSPTSELSWHFMHAPSVTTSGASLFNSMLGSGTAIQESVKMRQNAFGVQWGMKF